MDTAMIFLAGLVVGLVGGAFVAKILNAGKYVPREMANALSEEVTGLKVEVASRLQRDEVENKYVPLATYQEFGERLKGQESELQSRNDTIIKLEREVAELKTDKQSLLDKLQNFANEVGEFQKQSKEQFKNLANEIFDEKKRVFVNDNKVEVSRLLEPLKVDLKDFAKKVQDSRNDDIRDLTSLKHEIQSLHTLNVQLSADAQGLATALKSDVKVQGNWGEDRLKLILESEGMLQYIDYRSQEGYYDDEQDRLRKPDFVLNLPDGKQIIIDSKVSLTAYVNFFNALSTEDKGDFLKDHVKSLTNHIDLLAEKNYQSLVGITSPDFVFMFVPIESAVTLALNTSPELFDRALKKKIVITTPSMLIATIKVVKIIWQKENRVRNVEEIFKQCGQLHDKFVTFLEDLLAMGQGLDNASKAYKSAMDRLKEGARKGDTIIGRFDKIRELEARTNKVIPKSMLHEVEILDVDAAPEVMILGRHDGTTSTKQEKALNEGLIEDHIPGNDDLFPLRVPPAATILKQDATEETLWEQ